MVGTGRTTALGVLLAIVVSVLCWLGIVLTQHQPPTQTAAAITLGVNPAIRHYYQRHPGVKRACRLPVAPARFTHGSVRQRFQRCTIIGRYSVRANATPTPRPTVRPSATAAPIPFPTLMPLPTAAPVASPTPNCWSDYDQCLLSLINGERQSHNIAPLVLNATQSACSLAHSVHMAAVGYISHDQFPADVCIPWSAVGENVGEASGAEQGAILADFQQMIAEPYSPGCSSNHHCSIDSVSFKTVGIGIYWSNGLTWVTEDFVG